MIAEAHFELVRQSGEAMLAAISVFNNPNITFRTEIFITNAVIAWTSFFTPTTLTRSALSLRRGHAWRSQQAL